MRGLSLTIPGTRAHREARAALERRNATMKAAGICVTRWHEPAAYEEAVEIVAQRRADQRAVVRAAEAARRRAGRSPVAHDETSGGER